jgi:hypothetical protein
MSLAFEQFKELLRQLDELIAQNKDDSEEGDDLRDLMDQLWFKMTDEERKTLQPTSPV